MAKKKASRKKPKPKATPAKKPKVKKKGKAKMPQQYLYRDYVKMLSERFEANLSYLQKIYNFDVGRDFEVAICKTLRAALPSRFGVCRGHVIAQNGDQAGDDIIIFDRSVYPTLRLLPDDDYSSKEWIPIEAVYAYIEAKHTLNLENVADEDGKKATLNHALSQLSKVKQLCNTRAKVGREQITRHFSLDPQMVSKAEGYPDYCNPVFGMIVSRYVREGDNKLEDPAVIKEKMTAYTYTAEMHPDFILAGASNVALPVTDGQKKGEPGDRRIFFEKGCQFWCLATQDVASGFAICSLLTALEFIRLGPLPLTEILTDVLKQSK